MIGASRSLDWKQSIVLLNFGLILVLTLYYTPALAKSFFLLLGIFALAGFFLQRKWTYIKRTIFSELPETTRLWKIAAIAIGAVSVLTGLIPLIASGGSAVSNALYSAGIACYVLLFYALLTLLLASVGERILLYFSLPLQNSPLAYIIVLGVGLSFFIITFYILALLQLIYVSSWIVVILLAILWTRRELAGRCKYIFSKTIPIRAFFNTPAYLASALFVSGIICMAFIVDVTGARPLGSDASTYYVNIPYQILQRHGSFQFEHWLLGNANLASHYIYAPLLYAGMHVASVTSVYFFLLMLTQSLQFPAGLTLVMLNPVMLLC